MQPMPLPCASVAPQHTEPVLLARVFTGLSEPARLHILLELLDNEYNVGELVSRTGISQGRASIHLQCLRHCGFVMSERRGKYVYYRVRDARVRVLIQQAQELAAAHCAELSSCGVLNAETQHQEG